MPEYQYKVLTQAEMDDMIVFFLHSQETDKYTHEINILRCKTLLKELPKGKWRDQIQDLLNNSEARLGEINGIIAATECQLPPTERLEAAKVRLADSLKNKNHSS